MTTGPVVLVPKYARIGQGFSQREQLRSLEHPGRRTNGSQSAPSWIMDLADLKKIILLCGWCRTKFNPRRHGYRRFYCADPVGGGDPYRTNGTCDACKSLTVNTPGGGVSFVSEETYDLVCVDPAEQRREARMRSEAVWKRSAQARRLMRRSR